MKPKFFGTIVLCVCVGCIGASQLGAKCSVSTQEKQCGRLVCECLDQTKFDSENTTTECRCVRRRRIYVIYRS